MKFLIVFVSFMLLTAAQSSAADCADDLVSSTDLKITDLISCIQEMNRETEALEGALYQLQETSRDLVPKNAILVLDDPGGCPEGWRPYTEGYGRSIIGATWASAQPSGKVPLTTRRYRETGGAEEVALTEAQMPKHDHAGSTTGDVPIRVGTEDSVKSFQGDLHSVSQASRLPLRIASAGASDPHPNMPPYIALYFCKKT